MKTENFNRATLSKWFSSVLSHKENLVIWIAILTIYFVSILNLLDGINGLHLPDQYTAQALTQEALTAICFIFLATALAFIQSGANKKFIKVLPNLFGLIVSIFGILTVLFYFISFSASTEINTRNDSILYLFLVNSSNITLLTAFIFILTGSVIILLASHREKASNIAHFVLLPAAVVIYLVEVSYFFNIKDLEEFLKMPVNLYNELAKCAFLIAVFLMRPDTTLMRVFSGNLSGSIMARRLLPGVLLFPIIIGWLRLYGERAGLYNSEVGVLLVMLTYTVFFLTFIWFVARTVNRQELKRRNYEKNLAISESNFKAILNATKESVYMFDRQGILLAANLTGVERLKLDLHQIIGRHFSEFIPEQLAKSRTEKMNEVFDTGKPLQFEDERNGMNFLHSFYPVFENDEVTRLVTYSRDITERHHMDEELKARELKFRNIFENSNDAIIITHIESEKYIDCNKMAEIMTGYKRNEILSMKVGSLLKPSVNDSRISYFDKLKNGESLRSEAEIISRDGKIIPVEFSASLITIEKSLCIVSLMRDISERKKAEEQLKQYAHDLKKLIATKDKFFRIIAHDLKNPFSSLLTASEMLSKNAPTLSLNKITSYSEILNHSARTGYELLENLLEWSKTQTGDIEFLPDTINLKTIVDRNLMSCKVSALNKDISVMAEIEEDFKIYGDKNMIDTIIRNLLSNAIKFTHREGVITLSAIKNERSAIITVRDTGIGIEPDNIEKLFRIDAKFVNVGTANERGTGLGLLLCKEFVEHHGGKIRVESKLGEGSAFFIELPVTKETSDLQLQSQNDYEISK